MRGGLLWQSIDFGVEYLLETQVISWVDPRYAEPVQDFDPAIHRHSTSRVINSLAFQ
jgi:hypothetical protein